jgi:hypothetical protein
LSTPMPKETVAVMTGTFPSIHSSCTAHRSLGYTIVQSIFIIGRYTGTHVSGIYIQSGQWIRIRIQEGKNDP